MLLISENQSLIPIDLDGDSGIWETLMGKVGHSSNLL